jgi:hypothetical protein
VEDPFLVVEGSMTSHVGGEMGEACGRLGRYWVLRERKRWRGDVKGVRSLGGGWERIVVKLLG